MRHLRLFPAHAGVILSSRVIGSAAYPVPRTRGGDPSFTFFASMFMFCSPHTRG